MCENKIAYIYSRDLIDQSDKLPSVLNRASIVQDLINSYGLLSEENIIVVQSIKATENELKLFHSSDYIDFLKFLEQEDTDLDKPPSDQQLKYGLGYDCPLVANLFESVQQIAGGSVSAAKILASKKHRTVINWFGGWHHAQRNMAKGFCYVNDVVIAIQILARFFQKILYVDLDIHHGDGVENAFQYSNRILTLSLHRHGLGFFPLSGSLNNIGISKGKYYSINVPFKPGISDKNYAETFDQVFSMVFERFQPQAIVVQCGADTLIGDPIGECNLTFEGVAKCIQRIIKCEKPTLFLGGGGYNFPNTARFWTYLTSVIIGKNIENDIPDSCEFFPQYGPSFELNITKGLQKDHNSKEYLCKVIDTIKNYCDFIS